jgi:peptide-O-fucosyltransferase
LKKLAKKLNMNRLFLCTDAKSAEVNRLTEVLTANGLRVERFGAEQQQEEGEKTSARLSDAAISIIDQWICAHARSSSACTSRTILANANSPFSHFIGTHHSTFSLRIHEDREILGFPPESTFNRFCADGQQECEQPSKWTIQRES